MTFTFPFFKAAEAQSGPAEDTLFADPKKMTKMSWLQGDKQTPILLAYESTKAAFNVCLFRTQENFSLMTYVADILGDEIWQKHAPGFFGPNIPCRTYVYTPAGASPIANMPARFEYVVPGSQTRIGQNPELVAAGPVPDAVVAVLKQFEAGPPPMPRAEGVIFSPVSGMHLKF